MSKHPGKKRLISINKPAKDPNHRVFITSAIDRLFLDLS
jgi:hypothetical protein